MMQSLKSSYFDLGTSGELSVAAIAEVEQPRTIAPRFKALDFSAPARWLSGFLESAEAAAAADSLAA